MFVYTQEFASFCELFLFRLHLQAFMLFMHVIDAANKAPECQLYYSSGRNTIYFHCLCAVVAVAVQFVYDYVRSQMFVHFKVQNELKFNCKFNTKHI